MLPSGSPTPVGGQSMSSSLMRSNSGMLVSQGAQMPPQAPFSSLMSPRTQYNNGNLLGNVPSVSSLLNQYNNGGTNSGHTGRGGIDVGVESVPHSGVANGMSFNPPSSSFVPTSLVNVGPSGQAQVQQFSSSTRSQLLPDQQHTQRQEAPNVQHGQQQFSATHFNHQQPQHQQQLQQQYQSIRGGLAGVPVKLEPPVTNDQHGPQQQSQLQSLRGLGVKMEQQSQLQGMGQMLPVKKESQHSDQSMPLTQQQQQQQLHQMSMSRQSSQAATAAQINFFQQQKLLQLQQQQQHQLLKTLPQQRSQVPQQFQQQNMPIRPTLKMAYEPGMCAGLLTHYMCEQRHRPEDNNIDFWKKFVSKYYAPNAKKKWCVSMYGTGRQTTGVFPQDVWHCEICNHKPGRGFEATSEVLPRLYKIKYESGTLEELLYVDMPRECQNPSGQIVLDYAKAVQESVFEHLRVVREGQLRIVFSPGLKICSWEFCARKHEELIPRRLLIPQVSHLGTAAQKYQIAAQNASSSLAASDLQNNCNMFVSSARQLAKTLEVPLVNDLGYTKRYVRCLQISEVVNSMKDLMDYSRITGTGPMDSLAKFGQRTSIQGQNQQPDEQQQQTPQQQQLPQQQVMVQSSNNDERAAQAAAMQLASNNGMSGVSNTLNISSATTSASTIAGLLHQNSINARQQNSMSSANSPYSGNSLPSPAGSSSAMQQGQTNPSLQSPTPSSSNNPPQASHSALVPINNHTNSADSPANISVQQSALSGEGDANDSESSVQKMLQEILMSNQLNGAGGMMGAGSLGNEMKNVNGVVRQSTNIGLNDANCLVGNGPTGSNPGIVGSGFGGGRSGIGQSTVVDGVSAATAMSNNPVGMNGRVGLMARDQIMSHQQQEMGTQRLSTLGAANGFNNLHFDWKLP